MPEPRGNRMPVRQDPGKVLGVPVGLLALGNGFPVQQTGDRCRRIDML